MKRNILILIAILTGTLGAAPGAEAKTWRFNGNGGPPAGWEVKHSSPTRSGGNLNFRIDWRDGKVTHQEGVRSTFAVRPGQCVRVKVKSDPVWGAIAAIYLMPWAYEGGDEGKDPELDLAETHHPNRVGSYMHTAFWRWAQEPRSEGRWHNGWHTVRVATSRRGVSTIWRDGRRVLRAKTGNAPNGWRIHMNIWGFEPGARTNWGAVPPPHYTASAGMQVDYVRVRRCGRRR